jgi:GNAT superfamily N-acetyltransferase
MSTFEIVPYDRIRHGAQAWGVVKSVFAEYGFSFDEHGYDADLLRPDEHYAAGHFVVAEAADGSVVGCVGVTDESHGTFELHRLYVLAAARRGGMGRALVEWAIGRARTQGASRLILFSDIAFTDAHRLYERLGFRRTRFRYAPDPWQSREWGFELDL